MIYKFKVISIKTPTAFFEEFDKLIQKSLQNNKGLRIIKILPEMNVEEISLPDIKACNKVIVIKIVKRDKLGV